MCLLRTINKPTTFIVLVCEVNHFKNITVEFSYKYFKIEGTFFYIKRIVVLISANVINSSRGDNV